MLGLTVLTLAVLGSIRLGVAFDNVASWQPGSVISDFGLQTLVPSYSAPLAPLQTVPIIEDKPVEEPPTPEAAVPELTTTPPAAVSKTTDQTEGAAEARTETLTRYHLHERPEDIYRGLREHSRNYRHDNQ